MQVLRTIIKKLKSMVWTQQRWEEDYLSRSVDHVDLERRIKQLDRRQSEVGPFGHRIKQVRY